MQGQRRWAAATTSRVLRGLGVFATMAFAALLCGSPALAARGHVFSNSFAGKGPGAAQLENPQGVAVNESTELANPAEGDVYIADTGNNRIDRFSSSGTFISAWGWGVSDGKAESEVCTSTCQAGVAGTGAGQLDGPEGIAVDNSTEPGDPSAGDVYVTNTVDHVITKYSATGANVGQISEVGGTPLGALFGVATDPKGNVWIYEEAEPSAVKPGLAVELNRELNNEPIASVTLQSSFPRNGFAVDSEDNIYADNGEPPFVASKLTSSGGLLNNEVDPEQTTALAVEQSTGDVYLNNVSSVARFAPEGTLIERLTVPGGTGSGVAVNAASEALYVAGSGSGEVSIYLPEKPSQPTFANDSSSEVAAESAVLQGEVDPHGALTTYRFEYGPCATPATCASSGYGSNTPEATVGSDFEFHAVSFLARGLKPQTTYHFRIVATNQYSPEGGTKSPEVVFVTQPPGASLVLPDNRAWELVSPPNKSGSLLQRIESNGATGLGSDSSLIQASADGSAITYVGTAPTEAAPEGFSNFVQILSRRGANGWSTRDLTVPHSTSTLNTTGAGYEYKVFSADLSLSALQPFGAFVPASSPLALAPEEASEQTAFLHTDFTGRDPTRFCAAHCFHPLVTGASGHANVPSGTVFGEEQEGECDQSVCGPTVVGATPDLSTAVLSSTAQLTEVATPGNAELYDWSHGKLTLISVFEGHPATEPRLGFSTSAGGSSSQRNAISDGGDRIAWESASGLFMRDVSKEQTVRLDAAEEVAGEPCKECESGGGRFQIASSDGKRVFFTDTHKLTSDSGATEGEPDLYECEMREVGGVLECKLSDLTPPAGSGEAANVRGEVLGASEDGSWVYFVANGVQENASGAVRGTCASLETTNARAGISCNLYVHHAGHTQLIAVLAGGDERDWQQVHTTARVSPSGQWLAFMSLQALTGYDNRPAKPNACTSNTQAHTVGLCPEVYLFDATKPVSHETGAQASNPTCASCDQSGALPVGGSNIPGRTPNQLGGSWYQSRYLTDSGRLFFNSSDALVPQDVNGVQDVYEYEPLAIKSPEGRELCTEQAETFSAVSGGCVGLISSGTGSQESSFLDASETGGDVFFLTSAKLSPLDYDSAPDVYDAHECTTASPCSSPVVLQSPSCTTEASCKAAPTPQPGIFGAPSSATFSGPGNLTPPAVVKPKPTAAQLRAKKLAAALASCRKKYKHSKKKRQACEKTAHKRYGPTKGKTASHTTTTHRRGK